VPRNLTSSFAATAKWNKFQGELSAPNRAPSERLKRSFDVTAAAAVLMLFLPLFVFICCVLVLQGRPLLIRHRRVGRGGGTFPCLKFRTMVVDAEAVLQRHLAEDPAARAEWHSSQKLKNDPRVTALGRVLRKTSIDELPQLINVLRGEMSLVGPRPIVPAEVIHYGVNIERYHEVRPGITGAWQVSGRSNVSYQQRVALDCDYVAGRSFGRDLGILVMTIPAVLKSKGSY